MHKPLQEAHLLDHIRALPRGRASFKQLVKEFRAQGRKERSQLEDLLDQLADRGSLVELRSGHFVAVGANSEYVSGRLLLHRDGYGFLAPDQPMPGISGDIFLPPDQAEKGMHGDRALVRITRTAADKRAEGEIIRILRRAHLTVVGEFRIRKRGNVVVPADERIQQWIEIPEGMELPSANSAATVDRVGATTRLVSNVEDLDGMVVNVEILEFPEGSEYGVGRVVEILGFADDFGVDVEITIRKHHLPHAFPDKVLEQARQFSSQIPESEIARREDFRAYDIVTIDGETARDFDDAVWVEPQADGSYGLHVHIADVSHYVQPGSPIDQEALVRGTSVYFPDRAVPMLPVELSTDICSLRPQVDRLVLSAILQIDRKGEITSQRFTRGIIKSAARMTYTSVARLLDGDQDLRTQYFALVDRFEHMRDLALILNRKRVKRGSIDFDMPETNIELDDAGQMTGVVRSERNIAHRIIEEFMLSANEAVASHLEQAGLASIYRIHEQPDGKRVMDFEEIAVHFGHSLGLGALPVRKYPVVERRRDGRKVRKEITIARDDTGITSRHYQRLIAKISGKPEERILSYLMLRSLKQARYSEQNEGHFALAAPSYTHFTSPIRRYPDLIVHRILSHYLDTKQGMFEKPLLKQLGEDTSFTERRAAEAERELVEWKKVKFMMDRVGDEFEALIISTTKYGVFVELTTLFVEGLVPIETLPGDRYRYLEAGRKIVGERTRKTYSIGTTLHVRLDRADPVERKLQFAIVDKEGQGKRARRRAKY